MSKYVINLEKLRELAAQSRANADKLGVKLYFALKSCPHEGIFPTLREFVEGTTASGLNEARLCAKMGKDVHVHSPAYRAEDIPELCDLCSTIVFNSLAQYERFSPEVMRRGRTAALRINPGFSACSSWKYDPCSKYSRYGVTLDELAKGTASVQQQDQRNFQPSHLLTSSPSHPLSLHLHALCEASSDEFAALVEHLNHQLSTTNYQLPTANFKLKTLNLGGGMRISDPAFATPRAIAAVAELKRLTGAEILIEPSEYLVTEAGTYETEVLDIIDRDGKRIAIIDGSAACHMPDVLNMPYIPYIISPLTLSPSHLPYILAGNTCLSADVIGEYQFAAPLKVGDKIVFGGMGAYTFCQVNTFNGVPVPPVVFV